MVGLGLPGSCIYSNVLQGLRLPGSANGRFVDTIGIKIENRRLGFPGFCN